MPVRTIWYPDRPKTVLAWKNILYDLFFIKRSRLVRKISGPDFNLYKPDKFVRYSNGFNKMAAILFLPFENQTQKSSEKWRFEYRTVRYSVGYCSCLVIQNSVLNCNAEMNVVVVAFHWRLRRDNFIRELHSHVMAGARTGPATSLTEVNHQNWLNITGSFLAPKLCVVLYLSCPWLQRQRFWFLTSLL
jgi:hypothetical protein